MKGIFWLITFLTLTFFAKAQDALNSSRVFIRLPKHAQRISIEQAKEKLEQLGILSPRSLDGQRNVFNIDNIIVTMRDDTVRTEAYTLELHKSDLDGLYGHGGVKPMRSDIKKIKGVYFHIFRSENTYGGVLLFASEIKDNRMVFCKLMYRVDENDKALKAFDEIIKSFKYK